MEDFWYHINARWTARYETALSCGARLARMLEQLAAIHPDLAHWFAGAEERNGGASQRIGCRWSRLHWQSIFRKAWCGAIRTMLRSPSLATGFTRGMELTPIEVACSKSPPGRWRAGDRSRTMWTSSSERRRLQMLTWSRPTFSNPPCFAWSMPGNRIGRYSGIGTTGSAFKTRTLASCRRFEVGG